MISSEYAAGFFDADGSINIHLNRKEERLGARYDHYKLRARVSQTTIPVLKAFKDKYGGSIRERKMNNPNHKQLWDWEITTRAAGLFLEDVLPFLIVKRRRAELALELQAFTGHGGRYRVISPEEDIKRFELFSKIRDLNKKGPVTGTMEEIYYAN